MAYPRERVMPIKLVFNSALAIPQLKEIQESVKTKPIFLYQNALAVLYLSTEHRMGSVTAEGIIATLLHSLTPYQGREQQKCCLQFLSYHPNSQINPCCRKRAGNIIDLKLPEYRSCVPKNSNWNIQKRIFVWLKNPLSDLIHLSWWCVFHLEISDRLDGRWW